MDINSIAKLAFTNARKKALNANLSVLETDDGVLYEVFPDGKRIEIKKISPPIKVKKGDKIMIRQKQPYLTIDKTTFEKVILNLQKQMLLESKAYKLGLDLMEFTSSYNTCINDLLRSIFNEEQLGWIEWFLYERPSFVKDGDENKAWKTLEDGTKEEICYDIDSLWKELQDIETKNILESMNLS